MTNAEFKKLFTYCKTAKLDDTVWYDVFRFTELTEKQCTKLGKMLFNRGFAYRFEKGSFHTIIMLPSGISIKALI